MALGGLFRVQMFALLCNSFRLWWIGSISDVRLAIVSELFLGATFAVPYGSMSIFLGQRVPEELKSTAQGMSFAVFTAVGVGLGAVLGGAWSDHVGSTSQMFRSAAVVTALICAVGTAIHEVWIRIFPSSSSGAGTSTSSSHNDSVDFSNASSSIGGR